MADLKKTVAIIFEGDDTGLSKSLQSIGSKFDKFGDVGGSIANMAAPLAGVTDKILELDVALAAVVAGGMALAIKESSSFNDQFALVSTSIDATGKDLDTYRDQILKYSTNSVKSIDDINAALYTAAQAGIKYGDSLDFMGRAEQLAVANKANLNTTVDLLTGTMNAYGYKVQDVGHLNDVFFQSTLIGKQTIDELGQSMGQVVGIAANVGVSFEELQAAIATLTAKGMNTSDAITAIKAAISTIISPSSEAAKAAKDLGLNFSASSLKAEGFSGMMEKIMKATGGSTDKMTQLFTEVRAMNGAMQLTGDGMKFFNYALNEVKDSAGASEAAYQKMVGTFSSQSQQVINTAKVALIEVGTRLEPVAAGIAGSFGGIMSGITDGIRNGAFDELFAYITKVGKELAEKLKIIAANLPEAMEGLDFSRLIKSLGGLGDALKNAFQTIFGQIDLTTVEGLHIFIQKIIDGFATLIDVTKGIIDGMKPLFKLIGEGVEQFGKMDGKTSELVGTILGAAKGISVLADNAGILTGALSVLAGKSIIDAISGFTKLGVTIVDKVSMPMTILKDGVLAIAGPAGMVALAGAAGYATGSLLEQIPAVQKAAQGIYGLLDVNKTYFGILPGGKEKQEEINRKFEEAKDKAAKAAASVKDVKTTVEALPDAKKVDVSVHADEKSYKDTKDTIYSTFDKQVMKIQTNVDGSLLIENMTKVNDAFPKEKKIEVKADITQTAIAEIKEKSEIIQKSIEWKAKLDIANIEDGTKRIEAAFKSVDATIADTGKTLTSIVDSYASVLESTRGAGSSFMETQIQQESKRRDEALKLQGNLVNAQIDNLNAKTKAMNNGQAMIQIDGSGLQPHLEAFMFEILAAIEVKANAEGQQFLVGV